MPIRKRGDKWQAYVSKRVRGKKRTRSKTCNTEAEARIAEAELRLQLRGWEGETCPPLDYIYSEWKQEYEIKVGVETFNCVTGILEKWVLPELGGVPADKIRRKDIRSLLVAMGRKGVSREHIRNLKSYAKQVFEYAIEVEYLENNPTVGIKIDFGKTKKEVRSLTQEEINRINNGPDTYVRDAALISLNTGLRVAEVAGLTEDCVHKDYIEVRQQATGRRRDTLRIEPTTKTPAGVRVVPLTQQAKKLFRYLLTQKKEKWLALGVRSPLLILKGEGEGCTPGGLSTAYRSFAKRIGVPTRFHLLRHTYATELYRKGLDGKLRSQILGHTTASFTDDRYTHPEPKDILKQFHNSGL